MTRQDVMALLIESLLEILRLSGQPEPEITQDTRPLVDLAGFGSLNDVELTTILSDRFRLDDEIRICASDNGRRLLRIAEIVDRLLELGEK